MAYILAEDTRDEPAVYLRCLTLDGGVRTTYDVTLAQVFPTRLDADIAKHKAMKEGYSLHHKVAV